jgi:tRNA threonylcarbamoyladenosine modification (KEOPS) complex Cgi121 subunit
MRKRTRLLMVALYTSLFQMAMAGLALADPLDDAGAKVGGFLQKAGIIMTGLIPAAAGLAVGALAVKRATAKAMGEEEHMTRAGNQIVEVLKLTAVGMGATLIVAIAGSVLK